MIGMAWVAPIIPQRFVKNTLMKKNTQRFASFLILSLMALVLLGCTSMYTTIPGITPIPFQATPEPIQVAPAELPNPAYALAQATKDAGQSQLLDLARKSTEVALAMAQAANAAAQSTKDYNQRRKLDLDFQATVVSLNIAQAAATQKFITQQTKAARDAAAAVQSSALTATYAAYLINVDQTAQAQAILEGQAHQTVQAEAVLTAYPLTATYLAYERNVTETEQAQLILNAIALQDAQAIATLTAYPRTATPYAVTQAALLMQQYNQEQRSFIDQIVTPLIPILATVVLVLFILVIVLAYRRSLLMPLARRLRFAAQPQPLRIIDGVMVNQVPLLDPMVPDEVNQVIPASVANENWVHVEIVSPTEPPVAHWIAEVENQMAVDGGMEN
jgi:hypothetical protein